MGKRVLPAVDSPLSCSGLHPRPAHHFLPHLQEKLPRNDGLVAVLHIVLWDDSLIGDSLLIQEVRGDGLLRWTWIAAASTTSPLPVCACC